MSSTHKGLALGAIAFAALVLVALLRPGSEGRSAEVARASRRPQDAQTAPATLNAVERVERLDRSERVPVPRLGAIHSASAPTDAGGATGAETLEGRVVDGSGAPLGATAVSFGADAGVAAITDGEGRFRLRHDAGHGKLGVDTDEFVTVTGVPWPPRDASAAATIVAGRRSRYAGRVVDEAGAGLPGAHVAVRPDAAALRRAYHGRQRPLQERWSTRTDENGAFALEDVGWIAGTTLTVGLDPFESREVPLEAGAVDDLQVTLSRSLGDTGKLFGRVMRSDDGSVAGARVAFGGVSEAVAPDGHFVLELDEAARPGTLIAVLEGHLPAQLDVADVGRTCEASRAAPVRLVLDSPALSIGGTIFDAAGEVVPGAWVWTEDGTPFSGSRMVEDYAVIEPGFEGVGRRAEASAAGAFELTGLVDRSYDLCAVHPVTFQIANAPGVRAGTRSARIAFDGAAHGTRVGGRVLYRDGVPAPGVRVYPLTARRNAASPGRTPFLVNSGRVTDEQGHFGFDELFIEGLTLWITGSEIGEPASRIEVDLAACEDPASIEVRVPRVVRFEVVLRGDPEEADAFRALDPDGNPLSLRYVLRGAHGTMTGTGPRMKLSGGRSEVVSCSEDACTLVLLDGGEEVRRAVIRPRAGEVTVFEL